MKNAAKSAKKKTTRKAAAAPKKAAVKKQKASKAKEKATAKSPLKPETKTIETKKPVTAQDSQQKEQAQNFERAMALFHKRDFGKAQEHFEKALAGPAVEISHAAQMHLKICERRLAGSGPVLKTGEDHYNFGVTLMNRGELEQAEQHLRKAVQADSSGDHFHYALALCYGLRGNMEGSARHLQKAIELAPTNRVAARNDAEFQSLASHAALRAILYPERGTTG
ncbi:MAG: tetratricopeptide repeat protein [Acidimicrobiia bacterium]|nr:tetratricopeptide repeat protein [Acidimicrobiia bacterium]